MNGIDIQLDQVQRASEQVKSLNGKLDLTLKDIQKQMDALNQTWESDASMALSVKVKGLTPKFEEYRKVIDAYGTFLSETVKLYDTTEKTIKSNADAFK